MTINPSSVPLFAVDNLAMIVISLVLFIGMNVASFATRYLKGDRLLPRFLLLVAGVVIAVSGMVSANHMLAMWASWGIANIFLVALMVHKSGWAAARASGALAFRTLVPGLVAVGLAFVLLRSASGSWSIPATIAAPSSSPLVVAALVLLLLGAIIQSALWPFHRWLLSSLNSPTPVSALMHAGLINGGGILLARFAPLYFDHSALLSVIFVAGLVSALLGTLFKLMQHDVKRMLACSTMGQMGFMIAQCGLGLFPAAIAHLVWHGCFKAYLFLASGAAAQEKRLDLDYPPSLKAFAFALLCGIGGSFTFALASGKSWLAADTTAILVILAGVAGTQFALPIVRKPKAAAMVPLGFLATAAVGAAYGASILMVERIVAPLGIMRPQPLDAVYLVGLGLFLVAWLGMLFGRSIVSGAASNRRLRLYVRALNASQPHPATVTAHRNHYSFR